MTKRRDASAGSPSTRFKKGQSGNPKGRPLKPKPPTPSPFAILDELLRVDDLDSTSELALGDAMLIKTYQRAIAGGARAGKKIVKMIVERQKRRFKVQVTQTKPLTRLVEVDPENALEALEILGIASRKAEDGYPSDRLRLERWAVEAAMKRRDLGKLSNSDIQLLRNFTHDSAGMKWPDGLDDD